MLMKSPLSLEALEVIDTIERKGSFAAAATVLNKVPSAISYTVQKLEQDLGVTLFQKEGRRAVLTSAGQHLAEQGRHLLLAADELTAGTRQIATGWEPRLRIAVDTIVPLDSVLPLIADLQAAQPAIEIALSTEVLAGTWEALLESRVDLIIGGVGDAPGHKGIRCEPWRQVKHVFRRRARSPAVRAGYPHQPGNRAAISRGGHQRYLAQFSPPVTRHSQSAKRYLCTVYGSQNCGSSPRARCWLCTAEPGH